MKIAVLFLLIFLQQAMCNFTYFEDDDDEPSDSLLQKFLARLKAQAEEDQLPPVNFLMKRTENGYECNCDFLNENGLTEFSNGGNMNGDYWEKTITVKRFGSGFSKPYIVIPFILIVFTIISLHVYLLDRIINAVFAAFPKSKRHVHLAIGNLLLSLLLSCIIFFLMLVCFKSDANLKQN